MKTPEQIAQSTLDAHCIRDDWRRTGEQVRALIIEAVEKDRAQRVERDRAHHVKHEPRDWFTRGVYPWCSCGYVPLNNADLTDHWHENGIEWVDEHGRLVSRPYENKEG